LSKFIIPFSWLWAISRLLSKGRNELHFVTQKNGCCFQKCRTSNLNLSNLSSSVCSIRLPKCLLFVQRPKKSIRFCQSERFYAVALFCQPNNSLLTTLNTSQAINLGSAKNLFPFSWPACSNVSSLRCFWQRTTCINVAATFTKLQDTRNKQGDFNTKVLPYMSGLE
jgi:hypothetical protein